MKKELKFIIGILLCIIVIAGIVGYLYDKINIVMGIAITIITIIISTEIYINNKIKVEKLFLYIVPMVMIMFLIALPSWKNADEPVHWFRIYDITQGNFITKKIGGIAVAELPKAVFNYHNYQSELDIKYSSFAELYENKIVENGETVYRELATAAVYHPIQYMPQVIGTAIADIFTDRPFVMMYAARIANMLFSIIILYLAIKIIPYGKKIMLLLTCIPIAASSFASMSPDAMTISMSYLFISYILKLLNEKDKKINWKDKSVLLVMAVVIALCKIVYLPLAGLILLLPKEKYKTRKEQIITCIVIMGAAIISNLLWLGFSSSYLTTYKDGSPVIQLQYIIENPIGYVKILLYTINSQMRSYLYSLFGLGVGADLHIMLYTTLPIIILGMYVFLTITEEELKNKFTTYQKIIILLIILAIVLLIFTSLYIQWTPVNYDTIEGVQGRYFLPILPLISILIGSSTKIKSKYNQSKTAQALRNNNFTNICICNANSINKKYVKEQK